VEKMEPEVVEMYAQDRRARAQEVFLPFRRFCARRAVSPPLVLPFLLAGGTAVNFKPPASIDQSRCCTNSV
jgi:hypothetical protein